MTPLGAPEERPGLSLLGLARKAGAVSVGTGATRAALQEGAARLVLLAEDASQTQRDKILRVLRHRDVAHREVGSAAELGAALGRAPVTAVAVTDEGLARRLAALLPEEGGGRTRRG